MIPFLGNFARGLIDISKLINMKKITFVTMSAMLLLMASCKTTENAYKSAYEKAVQNDETVVKAPADVTPIASESNKKEDPSTVSVREESVTVVGNGTLKAYGVVCGSFSLKTNADAVCKKLVDDGYKAIVVLNESAKMYRVVCASFDTKEEAVKMRSDFKSRYKDNEDFQKSWILYKK